MASRTRRCRRMWRSVLLGVVLAGVLAGCSLGGGSGSPGSSSGDGIPRYGVIEGQVVATACDSHPCKLTPYRGSLVFCTKMGQTGPCPSAHVDSTGRYRIALRRGRHALIPAPGKGNIVLVKPRWVDVVGGQTRTVNIAGGNEIKMSREPTTGQGDCVPVCSGSES